MADELISQGDNPESSAVDALAARLGVAMGENSALLVPWPDARRIIREVESLREALRRLQEESR
jgi:hypothetical protein